MRPSGAAQADVAIGPRLHRWREGFFANVEAGAALAGSGSPRQAEGLRQRPVLFPRCARGDSFHFQVLCRGLAAVADDLVLHLLAFIECAEPCALYSRDVNKHVLPATLRLNEAVALGGVEPFHSSDRHQDSPSLLKKSADADCLFRVAAATP